MVERPWFTPVTAGCWGRASRKRAHGTYGHVIDELDHLPRIDAEAAIADARAKLATGDRPGVTS